MLTHREINERFFALDHHPALLRATFDGWLAWPIVKERLWLQCLDQAGGRPPVRHRLADAAGRLASGVFQALANITVAGELRRGVLLYEDRHVRLPDGRSVHPHLGDLARVEAGGAWLHYYYAWGAGQALFPRRGRLNDRGIGALCAMAAAAVRRNAAVRDLAVELTNAVSSVVPELDRTRLLSAATDQLGRFRARSFLMRRLFQQWKISRVIVLDPDGKVPEVAAAKSLGLPVTEVQHGMFGARDPDYSWGPVHRALPFPLPLPDRIVVFGPFWRQQLRRAGYWRDTEIVEARSPVLGELRRLRRCRESRHPAAPLRVLFPSQGYVRATAIAFWKEVLTQQERSGMDALHLRIKVHPLEREGCSEYETLASAFPGHVTIVPGDGDAFGELLAADIVAGYTSMMLMEALGLGIPALGIKGGLAPDGFSVVFDAPELERYVPAFADAEVLWKEIVRLREPSHFEALADEMSGVATRLYAFHGPDVEEIIAQ